MASNTDPSYTDFPSPSTPLARLARDIHNTRRSNFSLTSILKELARIDHRIHSEFEDINATLASARTQTADANTAAEKQRQRAAALNDANRAHRSQIAILKRQVTALVRDRAASTAAAQSSAAASSTTTPSSSPLPDLATPAADPLTFPSSTACDCRTHADDSYDSAPRFLVGDHAPRCALRVSLLSEVSTPALVDLLLAREDATRNQKLLVERLKVDNGQLRATYDCLSARHAALHSQLDETAARLASREQRAAATPTPSPTQAQTQSKRNHPGEADGTGPRASEEGGENCAEKRKLSALSHRVREAGRAACDVATRVEQRLRRTVKDVDGLRQSYQRATANTTEATKSKPSRRARVNEEFGCGELEGLCTAADGLEGTSASLAADDVDEAVACAYVSHELVAALKQQREAHARLRGTVLELTSELERIDPALLDEARQVRAERDATEKRLKQANGKLKEKEEEVLDLRRQLTKVVAEYGAVSMAHSCANAELSKIRANNRERNKVEQRLLGRGNTVMGSVENLRRPTLLHHR